VPVPRAVSMCRTSTCIHVPVPMCIYVCYLKATAHCTQHTFISVYHHKVCLDNLSRCLISLLLLFAIGCTGVVLRS